MNPHIPPPRVRHARGLFGEIAPEYDLMAELLSFGQNRRWRRFLVSRVPPGTRSVLDVATGTAGVAIEICRATAARVVGLDQSAEMLAVARGAVARAGAPGRVRLVRGEADRLPFANGTFDCVTFTYLLRYVDEPSATLHELARVLAPGGILAMLEFFVPRDPVWRAAWWAYTRVGLPLGGLLVSRAWYRTGRFLGPSISSFYRRYSLADLGAMWHHAGLVNVRYRSMSLGGGIVVWTRRVDQSGGSAALVDEAPSVSDTLTVR